MTSLVQGAGSGVYTAADVQAATGADRLAGWSLVIAYRDSAEPARNLTVFDGIKSIGGGQTGSIAVSGFTTPPTGAVRTRVGFVNYEGDGGLVGDSATLNGTVLSDAQHPATNFFNSRSSRDGVRRTDTDPNYPNQLGVEQSIVVADGILGNNATSATIGLTSSGDVYAPGVVTFATELYSPKVAQTKTVVDVNGGDVEQGDVLRYTIAGQNTGDDGAANFVVRDPLPTNTTYVPGSVRISPVGGGAATVAPSDATDADRAEVDQNNRRVVARMGTAANTNPNGGTVGKNATYTVTFDVTVNGPTPTVVPSNTTITNVATANFTSQSLGTPLSVQSSATVMVKSPDLQVTKTGSGPITFGGPYDYSIVVRNTGQAKTNGTVTVTDTLPTGLSFRGATPVSGPGWTCTTTANAFTCTRGDSLASGSPAPTYPPITLNTTVAPGAPSTIANTATVSGGGDGDPSNNTGTATNVPGTSADLAVEKRKTPNVVSAAVGEDVTYELQVTNNGLSNSSGSVVTDALPAGLIFSSAPGCTGSAASSTISCTVGPLAAGASRTFTVKAKPAPGRAGTTLVNTASVAGNDPDPKPGNNTSTSTVDVKPVDLRITNTIATDPATLTPGQTYTWQVGVSNLGGSNAPNTVVQFDIPTGTTLNGPLPAGCTATAAVITCALGDVGPGATKPTLSFPLQVTPGTTRPSIDSTASVSTTENDVDLTNNTAPTSTPVVSSVDLGVTLVADPGAVGAGDEVKLTATVTNNGPATPVNPTVVIRVPANTTFVSADPGCVRTGSIVTCTLSPSELESGESVVRSITVRVDPNISPDVTSIDATATVDTTSNDTNPTNDNAATAVPVLSTAGVSIMKTASDPQPEPGDTITYTLTARNGGPIGAQNVVVDDVLPGGTTFVSADAPCVFADGKVRCAIGDLAANSTRALQVRVRISEIGPTPNASSTHLLDVLKDEVDLAIEPNTRGEATVLCPAGFFASDGSVRVESVDQGAGNTFARLDVRESRQTADGRGWTGVVVNGASGRAQMKVTVVCLRERTLESDGHTHPLLVSSPQTTTRQLVAGRHEVVLTCGPGRIAVSPSYALSDGGKGEIRGSQRDGVNGWRFTVDVSEADEGTFSVRCLSTTTGAMNGHVHDLGLTQLNDTVNVPANQTGSQKTTKTLTCQDGKGIVGGYLMPDGLTSAGNDPQPVSRVFGFQNTTSQDLTASVGLLCLGLRTGGELGYQTVRNNASISTTTPDPDTTDNVASVEIVATPASGDTGTGGKQTPRPDAPAPRSDDPTPAAPVTPATPAAPATPVAPVTPAPAIAPRASILSSALRVTGTTSRATVAVPVRCAKACAGTATLVAAKAVKGTTIKKGAVLAKVSVKLEAGKRSTLRLVATGKAAKALKRGGVKTARLVISTGKGMHVAKTVKLVLR